MIELSKINHIFLYPGMTDMRLGIDGLRHKVTGELEENSLYVFCGKRKNMIKIIESGRDYVWLYQKRVKHGKFQWPECGETTQIDRKQLEWIITSLSLINRIESTKSNVKYDSY
jgi:transposase